MSSGVYSETTNTTEHEHEGLINGGENDWAKRSENSTPMLNSGAMIPATTPEHALIPLDGNENHEHNASEQEEDRNLPAIKMSVFGIEELTPLDGAELHDTQRQKETEPTVHSEDEK
jgi:hypothetical protein